MDNESASSPPPSSSPAPLTPSDDVYNSLVAEVYLGTKHEGGTNATGTMGKNSLRSPSVLSSRNSSGCRDELEWSTAWESDDLCTTLGQKSFSRRLEHLLYAVQREQLQLGESQSGTTPSIRSDSVAIPIAALSSRASDLDDNASSPSTVVSVEPVEAAEAKSVRSLVSAKRPRSGSQPSREPAVLEANSSPGTSTRKRRRLTHNLQHPASTQLERRPSAKPRPAQLFGAFGLRYAKGPGSLRRAESLRSDSLSARKEGGGELKVSAHTPARHTNLKTSNSVAAGSVAPSCDGCAPTVPTTPTTRAAADQKDGLANLTIIAPPPFELIPRAPLSGEEAAEARIACLLEKELELRNADGLQAADPPSVRSKKRTEDEEERFWMDDTNECPDEDDVEAWLAEEEAHKCRYRVRACGKGAVAPSPVSRGRRARTASAPIQLGIGEPMLEDCMNWILETMPPDDAETETSYVPGDLYDILSTSSEVRFHAGHLFLRYFSLVGAPNASDRGQDAEAFETVTWDIAVACLALSVKFHRDVLYPLDVIYAHEYIDLAPHALTFGDFENAQRDVLEALAFRVGSASPGAFLAELWTTLPTLRLLVSFDGGWTDVQECAWTILCNSLHDADVLRYPVSLLTAAALIEGVLEVLARRYKTTKVDGRGRALKKRDEKTLRKAAAKASRGVRLDIRDVLGITDDELRECREWLGLEVV